MTSLFTFVHMKVKAPGFPRGSVVKNPPAKQETPEVPVRPLGQDDPLEKEMATHSSTLAWKIPWTEERSRLQSTGSKELDTTEQLHFHIPHSLDIFFTFTIHNKDGYPLA